ncbi:PqqD family protein [Bacillus cereus]|uniref:PqqD family protein n=1 Tax=Bacillus nitratireducens TaxID=2026193 RepID=UPI000BEB612D|nr:PqqD family protein [Bacillus nitratireducens]PEE16660.1 PqqD family protein [Bacillus cereus]MED0904289.1 PqqD family protein [Bacillus nitratireducens]PES79023.1 PqqD family protein [Bacillus cereus]PET10899.1 PqqD family protein [Bacillus cereus]PFF35934.1 PqqD family protein [Bacillus cereus]
MNITYVKKDSVVFTEVDGEAVLLDTKAGTYFGLDEMGSFVWRQIENKLNADEIIELVKNNYQIDSSQLETVKNDIGSFLSKLEEKLLVYQGDQK